MTKSSLSYFQNDTDRYYDIRMRKLTRRLGGLAVAVYDFALHEIYRVRGCYLEWNDDTLFCISDYFRIPEERVRRVIEYCAEIGLFDASLLERGYLSSRAIQHRYLDMCRLSKRRNVTIPAEVLLADECSEPAAKPARRAPKSVVAEAKAVASEAISAQSPGAPPAQPETQGSAPATNVAPPEPPKDAEVKEFFAEECRRRGYRLELDKWEDFYLYYTQKGWRDTGGVNIIPHWRVAATRWIKNVNNKNKNTKNDGNYGYKYARTHGIEPTGNENYSDTL